MADQSIDEPKNLTNFDSGTILAIWITSILVVVLFGVYAIFISRVRAKKEANPDTLEFFVTARGTSPMWRVVWSFLAGSSGAWVLSSPPGYVKSAGVVGMVFYSLASGIPIFLLALIGDKIQKLLPRVLGFTHYVHYRYGRLAQLYVTLVICFNTGISMTAEYTAIGDIFQYVAGINRIPIVIVIGVVSMVYTAVGGLYASLITDQVQAIFSSSLLAIIVIYIAAVFRAPLGPLPESLQPNALGYHGIVAMPISLFCATIFSEGPWQRVWSSQDSRSLKVGAFIASGFIILTIFLHSFFGFLSIWAGYDSSNPNLLLFRLLTNGKDQAAPAWLVVIVILLAVTMSESAVDSQQNGVIDCLSTVFFQGRSVNWARVIVVVINIPVMIVSLKGYSVIGLFQISNLVTTTATLPFLIGLWEPGYKYFDGLCAIFGCIFSLVCVVIYGGCTSTSDDGFAGGVRYVFFEAYEAYPFVIGLLASGVGMVIWYALGQLWLAIGLPIIRLPGLTPGCTYETAPSSPEYPDSPPKYAHEGLNEDDLSK